MSTVIQFRRGTTINHNEFAGLLGEITIDTTKKTVVVHDGVTLGGTPLSKEIHTHTASDISGLKYQIVQVSGTNQPAQLNLNFSNLFLVTDDIPNSRTTVTLAKNNTSGAGTYGTATRSAQITINDQGIITSISEVTISGVEPAGTATGDLNGDYPGPSVASVGGQSASDIAAAIILLNNATNSPKAKTIVRRDVFGNFSANIVTADLIGNVTGDCSGKANAITGNLTGDITSTGMVTSLSVVNSDAGSWGTTTKVPRITVDAKGRITAVSETIISGVAPAGDAGGDLDGTYPAPAVATVGGVSAVDLASGALVANAAASVATKATIVKRDDKGSTFLTNVFQTVNLVATTATPKFDLSLGAIQQMKINKNTTISLSGLTSGQIVVFDFIHNNTTTPFKLTWPDNVFGGGTNVGVGPNKHNNQLFWCDGTNLYALDQIRVDLG